MPHAPLPLEPALRLAPELLLKAQGIRWAIFDVDGVLTDGRLYIGERGEEFKAYSTLDGHGLKLLAQSGIVPVIVTGRDSAAVRRRVADLGIVHAVYGASDKAAAVAPLMRQLNLGWDTLAAMGDDWPDLPLLTRAAFACAPANAHIEVKALVHHVTAAHGGYGAARECCDLLMCAAGRYAGALRGHLRTLDGGAAAGGAVPGA
jgi:3-deoxy-D-manno-octulosonate 8-phosphate phosphatase (KDO 8-P phosphatase)